MGREMIRLSRSRVFLPLLGIVCALLLLLACFQAVLFRDEQFAYRDAATFYYPLYLHVQREWQAGRWPLWEPGMNAGMPLLGLPMAAVFYPGKLVYAAVSYPWAARLNTVGHVVIAWCGMFALCRAWRLTSVAAGLAALAYAFGAPVLFQYCNIIYLVGAAWLPWGFLALEWLLGRGQRWALLALAVVLALQVLGGDPEAAYLTVLCGGGYALVLAHRERPGAAAPRRWPGWGWAAGLAAWAALTVAAAYIVTGIVPHAWLPPRVVVQAVSWGLVAVLLFGPRLKRIPLPGLGPRLVALAGSSALATALAGVQLVPAAEYARQTARTATDRPGRIYGFDLEPYRLAEAVWPDAFGRVGPDNRSWIQAIPPAGERMLWTPSLYLGGLTLALAAGGLGWGRGQGQGRKPRDDPAWPAWLALVGAVALAASFGRFGGPLWLARAMPSVAGVLGPHDPPQARERFDGFLPDGTGSVYDLLALLLPGLSLFRYPAKLLPVVSVAVAALAGRGWDRMVQGQSCAPRRWCLAAVVVTLVLLTPVLAVRGPITAVLGRRLPQEGEFGPVDATAAVAATVRGLFHGGGVLMFGVLLTKYAPRRPRGAGALALVAMTLDLAVANAPLVWTVPQAEFDAMPQALYRITQAESKHPSEAGQPALDLYRVHRMEMTPPPFGHGPGAKRSLRSLVAWQRDTLEPLYGLPLGAQYTLFQGFLDNEDYLRFFGSELSSTTSASYAVSQRGMSLWNARYLILPVTGNGWVESRGSRALERIDPPDSVVRDARETERWLTRQDWQLVQNLSAYPRAWLVHDVRIRSPSRGTSDPQYWELMQDLVYQASPSWRQPGRPTYDLRGVAFVETARPEEFAGRISRTPPSSDESVAITRYEPQHVELVAQLQRPGLVILADAYDPGWSLAIDGASAPIYRTNRMMRGAAVRAGRHRLVYTYNPASWRIGAAVSLGGLAILAALVPWAWPGLPEVTAIRRHRGSAP
jgi:hypothetical protein